MSTAHHLQIDSSHLEGNRGLGRYILLPGSADRAERIGTKLDDHVCHPNRRRLDVHLGRYKGIDVAAIPTGMGCPSVDIVVGELVELGARRMLRVGTSGALQSHIGIGDLVIATGAVRDEGASDSYTPRGFPAVSDPWLTFALAKAARRLGLEHRVHAGLVHSKDSFFGREFGKGPDSVRNKAYMERLAGAGVLASEMEAAHLFVLGAVYGQAPTDVAALSGGGAHIRVGALLAIIGSPEVGLASREDEVAAEERLIAVGLEGLCALWEQEQPK
jgi:uridine phosphorylase